MSAFLLISATSLAVLLPLIIMLKNRRADFYRRRDGVAWKRHQPKLPPWM